MSHPCALYRHFDDQSVLLYVGISGRVGTRSDDHAYGSLWVEYAAHGSIEWFPTLEAAITAEKHVIRSERPVFNKAHAPRERQQRIDDYLRRRGAPVEPRFTATDTTGLVTLREAYATGVVRGCALETIRKAAQRKSFPVPRAHVRGAYYYDPQELEAWQFRRAVA